jgi:hypothetical protein
VRAVALAFSPNMIWQSATGEVVLNPENKNERMPWDGVFVIVLRVVHECSHDDDDGDADESIPSPPLSISPSESPLQSHSAIHPFPTGPGVGNVNGNDNISSSGIGNDPLITASSGIKIGQYCEDVTEHTKTPRAAMIAELALLRMRKAVIRSGTGRQSRSQLITGDTIRLWQPSGPTPAPSHAQAHVEIETETEKRHEDEPVISIIKAPAPETETQAETKKGAEAADIKSSAESESLS